MATQTGQIIDVPCPNSLKFEDLARFAIQHYNNQNNVHLEFVNVLSAKEQIVANTIYYIILEATDDGNKKIYDTKIWMKEWENIKEVQEFKLVSDAPKPGGNIDVPCPNDLKFADLARFAVQDYNNKKKVHLEFVNVLCVKEQIVAGTIYYITLEAIDTEKKKIYETKIWVKEWENVKEMLKNSSLLRVPQSDN